MQRTANPCKRVRFPLLTPTKEYESDEIKDYIGAYNCLLDTTDELYNDIKYKDAINDWKQMSKDIRNVK